MTTTGQDGIRNSSTFFHLSPDTGPWSELQWTVGSKVKTIENDYWQTRQWLEAV